MNYDRIYNQIICETNPDYSIIVEDDGKVAYAYLLKGSDIIGDLWLYNQAPTPSITAWERKDLPFLNPDEYVKETISPIKAKSELEINWSFKITGELEYVLIYVRGRLIAKLTLGSKPGWSTCVAKSAPLAQLLINTKHDSQ